METWNQDPKKYLVMYLKLRKGIQFTNTSGEIETSLPEVIKPTVIEPWQYRMMLSLDGDDQFIEVVKKVKDQCAGQFEASDVWTFLYWLVDNELLNEVDDIPKDDDDALVLPDVIEAEADRDRSMSGWVKVPLQVIAVLIICGFVMYSAYIATPMLLAMFQGNDSDPMAEMTAEVESIQETRMPHFAEMEEVTLASELPTEEEEVVVEEPESVEPTIVDRLIELRQEMAACQIRRNECYLLNDEDGYTREVERISELAKEIGQISSDLLDEPTQEPIY